MGVNGMAESATGAGPPRGVDERSRAYWRENVSLQMVLLAVWAIVGYGLSIIFAEPLNEIEIGGFPLGFWFAQQGSIIVFVILIFVYAKRMDQIDDKYDVHEDRLGVAREKVGLGDEPPPSGRQGGDRK
jgi:putative solute:sodium symporter small subunit